MAFTKITAAGIGTTETVTVDGLTVINNGSFGGNLTVAGVLTYEDVTNVDSVGLITARNGIVVGSGITLSKDGDIFATGVCTATTFSGSGASLTALNVVTDTSPQLGGGLESNGFNINFADSNGSNNSAKFGASGDLAIYHDSVHSRIVDSGTGDLKLQSSKVTVGNAGNTETMAVFTENGASELYYDNARKFRTVSDGCEINSAEAGDACLALIADEGDDNADYFRFKTANSGGFYLQNYAAGSWETNIKAVGNGAVELYHDNSKKFETYANGVYAGDGIYIAAGDSQDLSLRHNGSNSIINNNTGQLYFQRSGTTTAAIDTNGDFYMVDDRKVYLGGGADLQLYHSSNNSYITNDTGYLFVQSDSISLAAKSAGENFLVANKDGAVGLYYNAVEKLTTFSEGVDVIVSGNAGLRIRGNVADVNPRIVFRRKNNDGNNSEPAAIEMAYQGGTTHESGHLDFYTNGDSGSAALARRVRIRNDGALLINTITQTSLGSHTGASNVVTVNRSGICLTAYGVVAGFYYDRINFNNSQYYVVNNSGTGVYLGNGNTSWTANSDERLKINITELDGTKAYNHVKTARATSYNWNATGHSTDKKIGFIAQDWETNYPEVVNTSTETVDGVENPKGIQYTETVPVLMAALKEAIAKIETLESRLDAAGL